MKNIHQKIGTILGYSGALMMLITFAWFMADILADPFQSRDHAINTLMINAAIVALGASFMAMGVWLRNSGKKSDR